MARIRSSQQTLLPAFGAGGTLAVSPSARSSCFVKGKERIFAVTAGDSRTGMGPTAEKESTKTHAEPLISPPPATTPTGVSYKRQVTHTGVAPMTRTRSFELDRKKGVSMDTAERETTADMSTEADHKST